MAAINKTEIVVIVVKKLADHSIGTGVHLGFQMAEIVIGACCLLVRFGISSHTDTHFRKFGTDQANQVAGVTQPAFDFLEPFLSLGGVTPQCHDVLDAPLPRLTQKVAQGIHRQAHAGEVSHGGHLMAAHDFGANIERGPLGGPTRPVSAREIHRLECHQAIHRPVHRLKASRSFGWEDLERPNGLASCQQVFQSFRHARSLPPTEPIAKRLDRPLPRSQIWPKSQPFHHSEKPVALPFNHAPGSKPGLPLLN